MNCIVSTKITPQPVSVFSSFNFRFEKGNSSSPALFGENVLMQNTSGQRKDHQWSVVWARSCIDMGTGACLCFSCWMPASCWFLRLVSYEWTLRGSKPSDDTEAAVDEWAAHQRQIEALMLYALEWSLCTTSSRYLLKHDHAIIVVMKYTKRAML